MNAILSEFTISGFKSHRNSRLPLGPLTVLLGANASGKSNAIEGLRFLSWLSQRQQLSTIQYETNSDNRIIRGRTTDLSHHGESEFSIGCRLNGETWNNLSITLSVRDGALHIDDERITRNHSYESLYEIVQPSEDVGTMVSVAYNNFISGNNRYTKICSDQIAIFTQLDSPANLNDQQEVITEIPDTVQKYQQVLESILFLDPVPAKMREYSFRID